MERLCTSLRLPDGELTEEIVAVKIVEVVKEGLRDPGEIYERVLSDLVLSNGPARGDSDSVPGCPKTLNNPQRKPAGGRQHAADGPRKYRSSHDCPSTPKTGDAPVSRARRSPRFTRPADTLHQAGHAPRLDTPRALLLASKR
jgi:hypothetical protein